MVEALEDLPYVIPGTDEFDSVTVEPIGAAASLVGRPLAVATPDNVSFSLDTGPQTVDVSTAFLGLGLAYSIPTAPAGVTINSGTGVLTFQTAGVPSYELQTVTVRATNAAGFAETTFLASLLEVYPAAFASVRADGFSADYAATPPTFDPYNAPERATIWRVGFTNEGLPATNIQDNIILTQRMRQPYPLHTTPDPTRVALSDYVYAGDAIEGGATNNSTEAAPKPIANWVMHDREVVGNTLTLEVVAAHRNARAREEVACVEFRVTDGTTTVTQKVNQSVVSPVSTDAQAVIVYRAVIDISTLADESTLTANAKVYPWFGTAASVLDSADSSVAREFSPRTFRKSVVQATSPWLVYVAVTGGDNAAGVVSQDPVAAAAAPCATLSGAIDRIQAVRGFVDGAEVRLMAGTHVGTIAYTTAKTQTHSNLVVTRDPASARSAVTYTFGAGSSRYRFGSAGGWLRFRDLTVSRVGATQFSGEAASLLRVMFEACDFNNGSQTASLMGANVDMMFNGVNFGATALGSSVLAAGAREYRMFRGVVATPVALEGWLVLGSRIRDLGGPLGSGTRTQTGSFVAYNRFIGVNGASAGFLGYGASADASQIAVIQNVFEFLSNTSSTAIRLSADAATGNISHIVMHHNTTTGFYSAGRANIGYNDGAVARTSKLLSLKGNIHAQLNTKHDVFLLDGTRVQGWAYLYGAGCEGEISLYIDAQEGGIGSSFAQAFPGFSGSLGTSATVGQDMKWLNYQGPTALGAGAGDGDYRIASDSPAKQRILNTLLRYDLGGNARPLTLSSSGCYE
jgi:hypothetical protein